MLCRKESFTFPSVCSTPTELLCSLYQLAFHRASMCTEALQEAYIWPPDFQWQKPNTCMITHSIMCLLLPSQLGTLLPCQCIPGLG